MGIVVVVAMVVVVVAADDGGAVEVTAVEAVDVADDGGAVVGVMVSVAAVDDGAGVVGAAVSAGCGVGSGSGSGAAVASVAAEAADVVVDKASGPVVSAAADGSSAPLVAPPGGVPSPSWAPTSDGSAVAGVAEPSRVIVDWPSGAAWAGLRAVARFMTVGSVASAEMTHARPT